MATLHARVVVAIVARPPRPRSFCARAPCGSRLFEIELKVALAGKESVIAEKNEIVTTARADTARARTALRMAIRRQAAWRAARAATVQRLAGMAASDAILEAVEDRDEAVGAADRRATAAEQRERAVLEKFGAVKSSLKYWRTAARRNARMRSDPAALRRLNRENHDLRAENFQLRVELVKAQKAKAPAAAVHVGKKPWLPRREQTRGRPHGQKLRLLYMKYECLRVAPNVMNEVRAGRARARVRV